MAMSETESFAETSTYLRVGAIPKFQEYTYSSFGYLGDENIDSETTTYEYGANKDTKTGKLLSMNFLKYTFFVKNVGDKPCRYNFVLNYKSSAGSQTESLDNTVRVMVYRNEHKGDHKSTVYGKRSSEPHINELGEYDYRSPISTDVNDPYNEFMGYAEMFESSEVITTIPVNMLKVNQINRFTVVLWLEGFRSNNGSAVPDKAKITIGAKINAYEI